MKMLLILSLCVGVTLASYVTPELKLQWNSYKQNYNKVYNDDEDQKRFMIFTENLAFMEKHNQLFNQGLSGYKMGINKFSDMTKDEFSALLKSRMPTLTQRSNTTTFQSPSNIDVPKAIDWRNKNAVTEVKDQSDCGSCWAFSTTGALEGQLAIKTGALVSLSEQELVDCSKDNDGCDGGNMILAFEYVKQNGLTSEEQYPYNAHQNECKRGSKPAAIRIKGYSEIIESEEALVTAVATIGPVSIRVASEAWTHYTSGVFNDPTCVQDKINHEVLVVGYNDLAEEPYWIVKNSWGKKWGEEGYIRLARNKNICHIGSYGSYPIM